MDYYAVTLTFYLLVFLVFALLVVHSTKASKSIPPQNFYRNFLDSIGLQPLSPLVVTVFERWSDTTRPENTYVAPVKQSPNGPYLLDIDYPERLVVVKPHNWIVYTNNGVNFYLISSNVSNREANCNLDKQLLAIDYRLRTVNEEDEAIRDKTGRLKLACLNYTLNDVVRLFASAAERTYIDLHSYFAAEKKPVTIDEILDYLLRENLI